MKFSTIKSSIFILVFLLSSISFSQCYGELQLGAGHIVSIKPNGSLWGWGLSNNGQLTNTMYNNPTPFQLSTATDWVRVSAGGYNTIGIKSNGTLWATGSNEYGGLGINSSIGQISNLQQIGTATNWLKVSSANFHSVALKTDGSIWAWGQNDTYQTGNNVCCVNQLSPVQVGTATDWVYIETGNDASCSFAIKSNGTLWGWGLNLAGLLGPSNVSNRKIPTQLNTDTDWASITVGGAHALALKTNGTLWSWGNGGSGQTGDGLGPTQFRSIPIQTGTDTWISVSGGFRSSFGVKSNGTLWAWGQNTYGELGLGNTIDQAFPAQIGTATNWVKVITTSVSGLQATLAIKSDGTVWGWGDNSAGQLGNGTNTNQLTPVQLTNLCVLENENFESETNGLNVYPNPAKESVTLNYNLATANAQIEIYDLSGRSVSKNELSSSTGELQINTSSYQAGIYIVVVKQDNKVIQQEKLIIE
jgi:alpha-tubulin suppressor-like RCC1 family protein